VSKRGRSLIRRGSEAFTLSMFKVVQVKKTGPGEKDEGVRYMGGGEGQKNKGFPRGSSNRGLAEPYSTARQGEKVERVPRASEIKWNTKWIRGGGGEKRLTDFPSYSAGIRQIL